MFFHVGRTALKRYMTIKLFAHIIVNSGQTKHAHNLHDGTLFDSENHHIKGTIWLVRVLYAWVTSTFIGDVSNSAFL